MTRKIGCDALITGCFLKIATKERRKQPNTSPITQIEMTPFASEDLKGTSSHSNAKVSGRFTPPSHDTEAFQEKDTYLSNWTGLHDEAEYE
eukprot:CAMPEP_0117835898 /NCGR_PEP_ID=MMETSP0949-20121206/11772_1 /TAXON_ID=44440 /ORGANISM="Chattonella subsalsa, Strain CCMP2191" /LENGTH=90 /DNA_ID=CAMNT_0005678001 /DNA_START=868 /DNA_END=1140 /DNA_ORIENTATION=-